MNGSTQDNFDALLRAADREPPVSGTDARSLPHRVRRAAARRRRRRSGLVAVAALVVVTGTWAVVTVRETNKPADVVGTAPSPAPAPAPVVDLETIRARLASAEHEADVARRTVEALLAGERARARLDAVNRRAQRAPDPLADVRRERDAAALLLVYEAEQLLNASRRGQAIAAYRRAVELFPQSPAAGVARQRLKDLEAQT